MDLPTIYYDETEWAKTHTGNKVNKKHSIAGTQNIIIAGKSIIEEAVSIRGDLATVKIGKFCVLKTRCVVRPCLKMFSKKPAMCNVIIGDYVFIEEDCIVNAAQVFAYVHLGARSILGNGCVIRECSRVLPDTVVPPDAIFPPFSTIAGNPARVIGTEPLCTENLMTEAMTMYYDNFMPQQRAQSFA